MLCASDTGAVAGTELSERYGVSRETFYLWRERRLNGDAIWFQDRSHAPKNIPGRTEAAMIERIVALRHRFPHFGPKKLRFRLQLDSPELAWPALSTIGDILARAGLVEKVRRQRRPIAQGAPAASVLSVNSEWGVGSLGERGVVGGFKGLVPPARRAADRSVDGDRQREPLSAGGTDSQAQP